MKNTPQTPSEEIINSVFKGRTEFYDKNRYIKRSASETTLRREMGRHRCVFLTGESGCGKTWLAQNYLLTSQTSSQYINLAEVAIDSSLLKYFSKNLPAVVTERTETIEGDVEGNGLIISSHVSGEITQSFQIPNDVLWNYLDTCEGKVVIFDNFESVIGNEAVLREIACLITLSDDPRMTTLNIRFLFIGTMSAITKYFETISTYQTIESRVQKVSIGGFTAAECSTCIQKDLSECNFALNDLPSLSTHIFKLTGGLPQAVKDLCYYIAMEHLDTQKSEIALKNEYYSAAKLWINSSLGLEYQRIHKYFQDNIDNKVPQNNYILYSMQNYQAKEFTPSELLFEIQSTFPNVDENTLSKDKIRSYLLVLADGKENNNILIQSNENGFKVKSYKTIACLDIFLFVEDSAVKWDEEI